MEEKNSASVVSGRDCGCDRKQSLGRPRAAENGRPGSASSFLWGSAGTTVIRQAARRGWFAGSRRCGASVEEQGGASGRRRDALSKQDPGRRGVQALGADDVVTMAMAMARRWRCWARGLLGIRRPGEIKVVLYGPLAVRDRSTLVFRSPE